MNREIKFRGISESTNKWFYGYGVYNGSQGPMLAIKMDDYVFIKEGSEGQFTGLHDKNGVEIYEGDLIKDGSKIFKIIFKHGCFGIYKKEKLSFHSKEIYEKFIPIYNYFGTDIDCVVIGNIYENENLSKQKGR